MSKFKSFYKVLAFTVAIYSQNSLAIKGDMTLPHVLLAHAYAAAVSTQPASPSSISSTNPSTNPKITLRVVRYQKLKTVRLDPKISRGWNKTVTRTSTPISKRAR